MCEPILSIHPQYAEAIFAGTKTVEFRRRAISVPESSRVWVYATQPVGGIVGYFEISETVCDTPDALWREYSSVGEIERSKFEQYFDGCSVGHAIVLREAVELPSLLPLEEIRETCPEFRPPQFYIRNIPLSLAALLAR